MGRSRCQPNVCLLEGVVNVFTLEPRARAGLQTLLSRGGSGRVMRDTALITGKIGNAEEYLCPAFRRSSGCLVVGIGLIALGETACLVLAKISV
jgi:hypothetical protein